MSTTSPASPELPAFALRHLHNIARKQGLDTFTIETSPGSNHGDGFIAHLISVRLTAQNGRCLALVCKMPLAHSDAPGALDTRPAFEREILMYSKVLPLFEKLQKKHGIHYDKGGIGFHAYPKCYLALPMHNNESIIVLDDLRAPENGGYQMRNKLEPASYEHAELLMRQLGRFHGLSFVLRVQQPKVFEDLLDYEDIFRRHLLENQTIFRLFRTSVEQAVSLLEKPADIDLVKGIRQRMKAMMSTRQHPLRLDRFGVMSHGDCHNNNLLYTTEEDKPTGIMLIDWQLAAVQSPASDVSNFLFWCTDALMRKQHLFELLHIYHAELAGVIQTCGGYPEKYFSFEDLMGQMREFGCDSLLLGTLMIPLMITPSEETINIEDMVQRPYEDDGDVDFRMMAPLNKKTRVVLKKRLIGIIADLRELGAIDDWEHNPNTMWSMRYLNV